MYQVTIDYSNIFTFILEVVVFLILMVVSRYALDEIRKRSYKILNPKEYFPEEEVHTLRQVYYLTMMGLIFIDILYSIVYNADDLFYFVVFELILSLYIGIKLDKSSLKNKAILLFLIPYGALTFLLFNNSLMGIMALINVPALIYFIKVYYDRFREYTESNGLGIAVILLFTIIFFSFFITQIAERVDPLNALVMVSNAFTSNGYAILGSSIIGKINEIFLVWSGYLLSGVGTATLTAAILKRHFDIKDKELNDKIDKLDNKIEKLEDLIMDGDD